MAKLTDLPPDAVKAITDFILFPPPAPLERRGMVKPKAQVPEHHNLDHTEVWPIGNTPKVRPHLERVRKPYDPNFPEVPDRRYAVSPPPRVTWPDGLPENPLLPLASVSRNFRHTVQETMVQNVTLSNQWDASQFLRTLTGQSSDLAEPAGELKTAGSSKRKRLPPPHRLAEHVRSLQFMWSGSSSMGRGGGSVFCDILNCCSRLQNLAISATFLSSSKELVLKAIGNRKDMVEFVILRNSSRGTMGWLADDLVNRLFSQWTKLEVVEVFKLESQSQNTPNLPIPKPISVINPKLRTIILDKPDVDGRALCLVLESSRSSLTTLKITSPSEKLTRPGLYKALTEYTNPDLESLTLEVVEEWDRIGDSRNIPGSIDPSKNRALLDIILGHTHIFRKLKSLRFAGDLASAKILTILPKSLLKLAWERSDISGTALAEALNLRATWLPKLKCLSIRHAKKWDRHHKRELQKKLMGRGICYHRLSCQSYAPQQHGRGTMADWDQGCNDDPDTDERDRWENYNGVDSSDSHSSVSVPDPARYQSPDYDAFDYYYQ
ncbi:hypothetical protein MJO28_004776 [Puccinia striiformis f. sp. tritici]|uniref:Uncharacterized protein n=1 Tax=Puccinia striiformis f. sp. tritici TaxID=168172 RepID=A0ACC0EIE9_9BASI|nr:hypothetical protein MJO28_004776 [Puccinia striiformis f. sp. tritici]